MTPPIILLNGWPGVGKDTVAETLKLLLGDDKASLVDWSQSSAEAFAPAAAPGQQARRAACLADQVAHPALRGKIVICTDCLPDTREGQQLARDFAAVAERCHRLLVPVHVDCALDENIRRLGHAERMVCRKAKVPSPNEAHATRTQGGRLFTYPRHEGLTVDNTGMVPHEAALQILSFVRGLVWQREVALLHDETTPGAEAREPLWA